MRGVIMFSALISSALAASAPTGLLVDYQKSPALGVRAVPHFGWIVPPPAGACSANPDHTQGAYQIVISEAGKQVWDSGKTSSAESTSAAGPASILKSGTPYQWTVTTWTVPSGGGA